MKKIIPVLVLTILPFLLLTPKSYSKSLQENFNGSFTGRTNKNNSLLQTYAEKCCARRGFYARHLSTQHKMYLSESREHYNFKAFQAWMPLVRVFSFFTENYNEYKANRSEFGVVMNGGLKNINTNVWLAAETNRLNHSETMNLKIPSTTINTAIGTFNT